MLRFADSFDHYTTAQMPRKWTTVPGSASISAANGRHSSACWRATDWNSPTALTFDNQATWIIGFAWKHSAVLSATLRQLVAVQDAGTDQVYIQFNPDATVAAYRGGGTLLGVASTATFGVGVYDYFEVKFVINNTTGSVEVRKNGVPILSLTGQDTQNTANNTANRVIWYNNGSTVGMNLDQDDLYVCDGQGSVNNDFLGDVRVDCTFPTAVGTYSEWTPTTAVPNWQTVDENPTTDDTDYVRSLTVGQRDTYNYPPIPPTTGVVKAVVVQMTARKDDIGLRRIQSLVRSGSTDGVGTARALGDNYGLVTEILEVDPATSSPWTLTNVNAAEYGVKLES